MAITTLKGLSWEASSDIAVTSFSSTATYNVAFQDLYHSMETMDNHSKFIVTKGSPQLKSTITYDSTVVYNKMAPEGGWIHDESRFCQFYEGSDIANANLINFLQKAGTLGYTVVFYDSGYTQLAPWIWATFNMPDPMPVPTKEGYVFAGWFYDLEHTQPVTAGEPLTKSVGVYAKFEEYVPDPLNPITLSKNNNQLIFEDVDPHANGIKIFIDESYSKTISTTEIYLMEKPGVYTAVATDSTGGYLDSEPSNEISYLLKKYLLVNGKAVGTVNDKYTKEMNGVDIFPTKYIKTKWNAPVIFNITNDKTSTYPTQMKRLVTSYIEGVTKYKVYKNGTYIGYIDSDSVWHPVSGGNEDGSR